MLTWSYILGDFFTFFLFFFAVLLIVIRGIFFHFCRQFDLSSLSLFLWVFYRWGKTLKLLLNF